jgi:hypothetical protein
VGKKLLVLLMSSVIVLTVISANTNSSLGAFVCFCVVASHTIASFFIGTDLVKGFARKEVEINLYSSEVNFKILCLSSTGTIVGRLLLVLEELRPYKEDDHIVPVFYDLNISLFPGIDLGRKYEVLTVTNVDGNKVFKLY